MSDQTAQYRRAVVLLSVAAFASAASARLCDPMLPHLADAFLVSQQDAARAVSSFSLAYGAFQVFYGPLGDRMGKYRLIALTTVLCTVGSLGAAFASSLASLVFFRFLTGAFSAGIIPLSMAWIGDTIPYEKRQAVLARFLSGQIIGVIGGQFIGGVFTETLGFRWAFAFMALAYAVIGATVYWESRVNHTTRHSRPTIVVPGGMLAQSMSVLRTPWARVILITVFLEGAIVFGPLAFVPSYLHARFSLSLTGAGALMGMFGIGGMLYILFAKRLVAMMREEGLTLGGGLAMGLGWILLARGNSWEWAIAACFLVGLGYYMLHNTLQINATQMASRVRGTAVSLFASLFFLGQSLGVIFSAKWLAWSDDMNLFALSAVLLPMLSYTFFRLLKRRVMSV